MYVEAMDINANNEDSNSWAEAATRMRAAGVTSVVLQTIPAIQIMSAADGLGWFPEWLLFFPYGPDINIVGLLMPQDMNPDAHHLLQLLRAAADDGEWHPEG